MSHVDPEILALLALGEAAGTPQDSAHLPDCAHCQAELRQLTQVVTIARQPGGNDLLQPPPALWERITAELAPEIGPDTGAAPAPRPGAAPAPVPGLAPVPGPATPPAGSRPGRQWWRRPAIIALAALLIGGIGGGIVARDLRSSPAPNVVARIALRPLPQFPQWRSASGMAVMERASAGRLLRVTVRAPARPGFFEVWLLARDGVKMISLGDLDRAHTGVFAMPPGVNLSEYSRIDVSLQPFNGSTLHSKVSVLRGSLP